MISPESRYLIDGAIEHLEITPDTYWAAFHLNVDAIVDRMDAERRGMGWREWDWSDRLIAAVEQWWAQAPLPLRVDVSLRALHGFGHFTLEAARFASSRMVREASTPTEALDAPLIRRWCGQAQTMLDRSTQTLCAIRDVERVSRALINERAFERAVNDISRTPIPIRPTRQSMQDARRARKVLRRSAAIGDKIAGRPAVRAILRGDEAIIEGMRYNYHIERMPHISLVMQAAHPDLMQHPLRVNIHRKDGKRLAYGCIYFEKTPALDQLVALALHVRDREAELDLLRTANLSKFTPEYADEATLCEIAPPPQPHDANQDIKLPIIAPEILAELERIPLVLPDVMDALRERLGLTPETFDRLRGFRLSEEWFDARLPSSVPAVIAGLVSDASALARSYRDASMGSCSSTTSIAAT